MRLRDEHKRRQIIARAAKLFATLPYHKVRLDDVAAEAGIGKGTVYIYFKSKEDLYYSLVAEGFGELVHRLQEQLQASAADYEGRMRTLVSGLVEFALLHPELFEVMRTVGVPPERSLWDENRKELSALIERVIRQGVALGECDDEHPDWTSLYLPAMVRATMLYYPKGIAGEALVEHLVNIMSRGTCKCRAPLERLHA